ncbi:MULTISPECIES: FAD-binding oxidoreductase [unclassified Arthrobacter]|uniref:NAD(P)/FAD-dependent oxidoreductase n=1 Tax=unclassified Arthrobacter TaxID=235627 RepID=UPI001E47366D|nr:MULTISPECIES: FAD-binding oxidoreductase [unclassified Arthrobacter]MCC9145969.1 FAD-binding oxidoreductase [Arthrobacter sp. zg-Y919]MDK1277198.1 FAD-binding oxidoreductase [Arthrobacter sp. zg.Y919]WIB03712.1 FAD-binding oxidoreductase [Arthrobacter sp. zg-Y919]
MSQAPLPPASVAVLGGGVLGLSTAVQLLRGGADVLLVTEAEVGSGASGRSLSWLNAGGGYGEDYYRLRMAGIDRYRTLLAQHPCVDWLAFDGGLYWDDDPFTVVERHNTQSRQGYDARMLEREDVPGFVPGVDPGVLPHRVLANPGEGWVSLPHLVRHLAGEFTLRGGTLIEHAGLCTVTRGADDDGVRARGLRTAGGEEYAADAVVVACGAGIPAVLAAAGIDLPDASDPAMLVISEPVEHGLRAVLNTPRISLRPHPGGRLAMDSTWYLDRVQRRRDGGWDVDPEVPVELAAEASRVLAGHPEVVPQSWHPGLKPVPGDGEPVLGELDALPGCWAVFTHSGATLGLIAGELVAGEILTGRRYPLLEPFRAERFR